MQALTIAGAILLVCLGAAALAAVPFLIAIARRHDAWAVNIEVQNHMLIDRYNSSIASRVPPSPPAKKSPKRPNLYPIRDKDGPSKNDKDLT